MKRSRLILLGIAWLGLAAFAGYETTIAARQREQLEAAQKRSTQLLAESARLQRENAAVTADLTQAERQLTELTTVTSPATSEAKARQLEIAQWSNRIKRLRRMFEEKPEQRIPEMKLLDDQDWLRAAKRANFETDEDLRLAFASVRNAAVDRYGRQLAEALRTFAKAATAETKPDALALGPLLAPDVDPTFLTRYEMTMVTRPAPRGGTEWRVANKAPIDEEYDVRYEQKAASDGSSGMSGGGGVTGWIPNFSERAQQARKDFSTAQNGAMPASMPDVLPYFKPPLDPATIEKIRAQYTKAKK